MNNRIDSLSDGVASLVEQVPEPDIPGCCHMLSIAALSVVGYSAPEVDDALAELRDRGTVAKSTCLTLNALLAQRQQAGWVAGRRGDSAAREKAFFEARALSCAAYAVGAIGGTPRERLREAAYEATAAFRGTPAVVDVLSRYTA